MLKIPCLFHRDHGRNTTVRDEVTPGCEWVLAGEGVPTEKYDGTACMVRHGVLYKRYDCKHGKTPPCGFIPCGKPNYVTGHFPGWMLVGYGPEDQWHREAVMFDSNGHLLVLPGPRGYGRNVLVRTIMFDHTYELVGPKVQGNPHGLQRHALLRHGVPICNDIQRTFEGIGEYLSESNIEGIVFWHPDGARAKIRRKDFGLDWPLKREETESC